jgi:hypothetical protein
VQDAVYNQATSRLDPRFKQAQDDIAARLAAQGISENSDAYRREQDNFGRTKNDAYNQAVFNAITAGGDEQSRLFKLALAGRQQGQDEANDTGEFANTAQQQGYAQSADQAERDLRQEQFNRDLQLRTQGMDLTKQNQQFNQGVTNANLANTGRQQEIQEQSYDRNIALNDIAALLGTGGGVSVPQFGNVSQVGVAPPDYQGLVTSNYNQQMAAYNAAQAARAQGIGGILGGAASLGSAAILASDRRLKVAIRQIGKLANGLPTYLYKYIGDNVLRAGVMAQDVLKVLPDAVHVMDDGFMAVDYEKVLA